MSCTRSVANKAGCAAGPHLRPAVLAASRSQRRAMAGTTKATTNSTDRAMAFAVGCAARSCHRVTARSSKGRLGFTRRPYQTQAIRAAATSASSNAYSVRASSPATRLLFIDQSFPPCVVRHNRPNPVTSAACHHGPGAVCQRSPGAGDGITPRPSAFRRRSVDSSGRPTVMGVAGCLIDRRRRDPAR